MHAPDKFSGTVAYGTDVQHGELMSSTVHGFDGQPHVHGDEVEDRAPLLMAVHTYTPCTVEDLP